MESHVQPVTKKPILVSVMKAVWDEQETPFEI